MTTATMPSKSVFYSTIQWATFVSTAWIITNLFLRPFDLSLGELDHDQVSAIALVLFNGYIFIQRLRPQSKLYWVKEIVDEVNDAISEGQDQENRDVH
jgi:hypothetical protein